MNLYVVTVIVIITLGFLYVFRDIKKRVQNGESYEIDSDVANSGGF